MDIGIMGKNEATGDGKNLHTKMFYHKSLNFVDFHVAEVDVMFTSARRVWLGCFRVALLKFGLFFGDDYLLGTI